MRTAVLSCFSLLLSLGLLAQKVREPDIVGGKREWKYLVETQLQYPYASIQAGEQGTVSIDCYVSGSGKLEEIEFIKSVSPAVDREALRILKHVVWRPGVYEGSQIQGVTRMKIDFFPDRYYRYCRNRGYRLLPHPVTPVSEETTLYTKEEVDSVAKPLIPGGWEAFPYILSKLKYPEDAVRESIQGEVRLRYVVEQSGHITNVEIVQNVGGGCPQEVTRVLRSLDWIPAIRNGMAVRSTQEISILFHLEAGGTAKEFVYGAQQGIY